MSIQIGIDALVSLTDRLTRPLRNVEGMVAKASERMQKRLQISANLALAGEGASRLASRINSAVGSMVAPAIAFESAMADVKKVVDFDTPEAFRDFGRQIQAMSRDIPIAAEGLAAIAAAGGQLGIARTDLPDFVETVAKMSTAFDLLPEQAGEAMAKLSNVYQIPIAEMESLGDAINYLSDNTAAKASDIVTTLGRIGGTAKQFGLTATEAAALADAFIALGKPSEVAATAINAMLLKMQTATKQGDKFREALQAIGMDAGDLEKAIAGDAQGALIGFLEQLEAVDPQARAGLLSDLFGLEYSDDIALLAGSLGEYRKAMEQVGDASQYAGSMNREFKNRAATTENGLTLLANRMKEFKTNIGSVILPSFVSLAEKMGGIIERMTAWAEANPGLTRGIVTVTAALGGLAAVIAPVLLAASALTSGWAVMAYGAVRIMAAVSGVAGLIGKLGAAFLWLGRVVLPLVGRAVLMIGRSLMLTPIGAVVAAIAGAAYLIYRYWEPISEFFQRLWGGVVDRFNAAIDWISGIGWDGIIPVLSWDQVLTALDWATWLIPLRWLDFIPGFSWKGIIETVLNWGDYIPGFSWSSIIGTFNWGNVLTALDWLTWLSPLRWSEFIPSFEWSSVIAVLDIRNWLNFSWSDVLPDWNWKSIIPELPDLKSMFTDADETIDIRLENRAGAGYGQWERGIELVDQYRQGLISIGEMQAELAAKVATEEGAWNWSKDVERAADMLKLLEEINAAGNAAPDVPQIDNPETLLQAARAADELIPKFPAITGAANETLSAVQAAILQITTLLQKTSFAAEGAQLMQSFTDGILAQIGAVTAAVQKIAATVRINLPASASLSVSVAGIERVAANATAAPQIVQARARGGSYNPGWLLTGEEGPEQNEGGFIAHNRALRGMVALAARVREMAQGISFAPTAGMVPVLARAEIAAAGATSVRKSTQVSYSPTINIPPLTLERGVDLREAQALFARMLEDQQERAQVDLRRVIYDI